MAGGHAGRRGLKGLGARRAGERQLDGGRMEGKKSRGVGLGVCRLDGRPRGSDLKRTSTGSQRWRGVGARREGRGLVVKTPPADLFRVPWDWCGLTGLRLMGGP